MVYTGQSTKEQKQFNNSKEHKNSIIKKIQSKKIEVLIHADGVIKTQKSKRNRSLETIKAERKNNISKITLTSKDNSANDNEGNLKERC